MLSAKHFGCCTPARVYGCTPTCSACSMHCTQQQQQQRRRESPPPPSPPPSPRVAPSTTRHRNTADTRLASLLQRNRGVGRTLRTLVWVSSPIMHGAVATPWRCSARSQPRHSRSDTTRAAAADLAHFSVRHGQRVPLRGRPRSSLDRTGDLRSRRVSRRDPFHQPHRVRQGRQAQPRDRRRRQEARLELEVVQVPRVDVHGARESTVCVETTPSAVPSASGANNGARTTPRGCQRAIA
jgi:hypothetical protein